MRVFRVNGRAVAGVGIAVAGVALTALLMRSHERAEKMQVDAFTKAVISQANSSHAATPPTIEKPKLIEESSLDFAFGFRVQLDDAEALAKIGWSESEVKNVLRAVGQQFYPMVSGRGIGFMVVIGSLKAATAGIKIYTPENLGLTDPKYAGKRILALVLDLTNARAGRPPIEAWKRFAFPILFHEANHFGDSLRLGEFTMPLADHKDEKSIGIGYVEATRRELLAAGLALDDYYPNNEYKEVNIAFHVASEARVLLRTSRITLEWELDGLRDLLNHVEQLRTLDPWHIAYNAYPRYFLAKELTANPAFRARLGLTAPPQEALDFLEQIGPLIDGIESSGEEWRLMRSELDAQRTLAEREGFRPFIVMY